MQATRTIRRSRTESLQLIQTALSTGSVVTHLSVMGVTIVKGR